MEHHQTINRRLGLLERNTRCIALQPVHRVQQERPAAGAEADREDHEEEGSNRPPFVATLSRCSRDFHVLWHEYEFGIGGQKPAKDFTPVEHGKVKAAFSKRRLVWETIERMVRAGHNAQMAVDKIYDVYFHLFVTEITKKL
eukprot:14221365-Ditylum_brightwellii.AAC.1